MTTLLSCGITGTAIILLPAVYLEFLQPNLMKKIIFSLVIIGFWIVSYGAVNFANASNMIEVCRLNGQVVKITDDYVFLEIKKASYDDPLSLGGEYFEECKNIMRSGALYRFSTRINESGNSFFRGDFRNSSVGQSIVITKDIGNAMGPEGEVNWEQWVLRRIGNVEGIRYIELEKDTGSEISAEPVYTNDPLVKNILSDSLVENRTYTIAKLNKNTSIAPRKFFTEAYVSYIYICPPCGGEALCMPCLDNSFIILSEDFGFKYSPGSALDKEILVYTKSLDSEKLVEDQKYRFEVSIQNTSNTNVPQNEFTLISVKNIDGSVVAPETTAPPITDQPPKKSFFGRIWNWFARLFE